MHKLVFTLMLISLLAVVSFASTDSAGDPNYKHQSGKLTNKSQKGSKHAHVVVPFNHYTI